MTSCRHPVPCLKGEELDKRLYGPFTCESHAADEGGVFDHLTVVIDNHLEREAEMLSKYTYSIYKYAFILYTGVWGACLSSS